MMSRCDRDAYDIDRVSGRHRRRFESARHFIPQIAPRLAPQDKEESCICAIDGGIKASLKSGTMYTCEVILLMKRILQVMISD